MFYLNVSIYLGFWLSVPIVFLAFHNSNANDPKHPGFHYETFEEYKSRLNKTCYQRWAEIRSRKAFEDNMRLIQTHNTLAKNGTYSFELRSNIMADYDLYCHPTIKSHADSVTLLALPTAFPDNALTGNHGCAGGSLRNTLRYLEQCGCLMRQQDYPYTASQNLCKFNPELAVVNVTNWAILPARDEDALRNAVAIVGPIAVSINAAPKTFQLYSRGVYDDRDCSADKVNHAMLLLGYTPEYWILKNWWGKNWGNDGYMKVKRGVNLCGISNFAAYAVV